MFKVVQNVGGAEPQTTYKAFNWDQSYRKAILYTAAPDDKLSTPLWRVDNPLTTVAPIVQAQLQQQLAPPPPVAPPTPPTQPGQPAAATPTPSTTAPPPTATAVAVRVDRAVQPGELSEFRGGQRRRDVLLRPGRGAARLIWGVAGAGAPVGDRPDDCVTLSNSGLAEGQLHRRLPAVTGSLGRVHPAWATTHPSRWMKTTQRIYSPQMGVSRAPSRPFHRILFYRP